LQYSNLDSAFFPTTMKLKTSMEIHTLFGKRELMQTMITLNENAIAQIAITQKGIQKIIRCAVVE
jgi:hypothetical protein